MEVPLQKSVIHEKTWCLATLYRSRCSRCLTYMKLSHKEGKKRRYHAHIFIILLFFNIKC